MASVSSFPAVVGPGATRLVLGSMPGVASLAAHRYYAHPRNAFWRIAGDLLGLAPDLPYAQKLIGLQAAGIALWDVIASCERAGSLDADIVGQSVQVNDFSTFFAVHRGIRQVFFNGGAAEAAFRRHVLPGLSGHDLRLIRLPSTSPAHAGMSYADKLAAWSAILAQ